MLVHLPRRSPISPFFPLQNFLDFFFLFLFFCVILSIVMHLYAVRGVEGDFI
jgi:hypothetical protein